MKPLLYLSYKTAYNGVMRALGSPTRLIGILFLVGYYFMWFVRPVLYGNSGRSWDKLQSSTLPKFEFPPIAVIDAAVFALFLGISFLLMLGVLSPRQGFRPADADVLFATPVDPKIVLTFRLLRDLFFTLLFPLLILLFGIRPMSAGWSMLFRDLPDPSASTLTAQLVYLSWILVSMVWITLAYMFTLLFNRSETRYDGLRKALNWGIGILTLVVAGYVGWGFTQLDSLDDLVRLAHSPFLRIAFPTASLATMFSTAPLSGSWAAGAFGFGGLLAIIGFAVWKTYSQVGWLYDQAAVRVSQGQALRSAQRAGDVYAAAAELAREGKSKTRQFRLLQRIWAPGPWALVYKDLLLQGRGMMFPLLASSVTGLALSLMPALTSSQLRGTASGAFFLGMQMMVVFIVTMAQASTGFMESLRRVDLQKSLPFTPTSIVFFEMLAKSVLGSVVCWVGCIVSLAIKPDLASYIFAAILFCPALSLLLSAAVFCITILFPDIDDQSQRQFKGLMMMLSIAIMAFPPAGLFIGLLIAGVPAWLAAVFGSAVCWGIAFVGALAAGRLYADYNPSD
ncbi:MAG: hypothetical protein CNCCGFBP_00853 [Fimbriimonadaceae bacterium]|nr:hypothetical protein [Fimbriimonadaceae bacterium]